MCWLVHSILTVILTGCHSFLIILNGYAMLFKVRTMRLHAVLLHHSLKGQQGYLRISSAEGMPGPKFCLYCHNSSVYCQYQPILHLFLGQAGHPYSQMSSSQILSHGALLEEFETPFAHSCFHSYPFGGWFPHYEGEEHAQMVKMIKILPLLPSTMAIHCERSDLCKRDYQKGNYLACSSF